MSLAARDLIRSYFARWERLQDEQEAIKSDLSELFKEAKAQGFDVKALRKAFTIRRNEDETAAVEFQAVCEMYLAALGLDLATRADARQTPEFSAEVRTAPTPQGESAGVVESRDGERARLSSVTPVATPEGQGQTAASKHDQPAEVEHIAPEADGLNEGHFEFPELPDFLDRRVA